MLAFLPGQREIERTAERLDGRVGADVDIVPLYGMLDGKAQDAAIRPAPPGRRKVVLATSIAETSITIDGVRVVIDCGLSRLPRYEPASGLTRLETVRVSRAAADQRAGRAGRTSPASPSACGAPSRRQPCPPFTPPEILEADLSGFVLDCAAFGVADPATLAFLDPPPAPALAEARALLRDARRHRRRRPPDRRPARRCASWRCRSRLAHMVAEAARQGAALEAAQLAVLLTERGLGGDSADLERRLSRFRVRDARRAPMRRGNWPSGWRGRHGNGRQAEADPATPGALLLHAWPDRVAKARGERGRFVLANGSGAALDAADPLAGEPYLVVADLQGKAQNARIASAAAVTEADIRAGLAAHRDAHDRGQLRPRKTRGARARNRPARRHHPVRAHAAGADGRGGRPRHPRGAARPWPWRCSTGARRPRRCASGSSWLHRGLGEPWPDMSDEALLAPPRRLAAAVPARRGVLRRIGPASSTTG